MSSPLPPFNPTIDPTRPGETANAIQSLHHRRYVMTSAIVSWLRDYYGDPNNIEEPVLRAATWTPAGTGILIESLTRWAPAQTNIRPTILVHGGEQRPMKRGIGDNEIMPLAPSNRGAEYLGITTGQVLVYVVGDEAGEIERWGSETFDMFRQCAPIFRAGLCLDSYSPSPLSPVRPVKEAAGAYVLATGFSYVVTDRWRFEVESPAFQKLQLNFNLNVQNAGVAL